MGEGGEEGVECGGRVSGGGVSCLAGGLCLGIGSDGCSGSAGGGCGDTGR